MRQGNRVNLSRGNLWIVFFLIALIIFLGVGNYFGLFGNIHAVSSGPIFLHHWFSFIGSAYIAVYVPIHHYLRLKNPSRYGALLKYHVYGNLISVGLITIHFSQQFSRPAQFAPDFGTGVALVIIMALLVLTGILLRFGFIKARRPWWRYIHTGLTTAFYLIIVIHALQGFEII